MKTINFCKICDFPIKNSEELCTLCKNKLFIFEHEFTCNCEDDVCMSLCRDCILNSIYKERWKEYLNDKKLKLEV